MLISMILNYKTIEKARLSSLKNSNNLKTVDKSKITKPENNDV